jgi:ABC-type multidrug transport system fused ATPase/permease subunit
VLKDLTLQIAPGETVGIVGRTGAGKSSVVQALFRMAELRSGAIHIDNADTAGIDLTRVRGGDDTAHSQLRRAISVVPQEPFITPGSIRDNIDPLHQHTDAELNDALGLLQASSETRFKLDDTVSDVGNGISVGEKQLRECC